MGSGGKRQPLKRAARILGARAKVEPMQLTHPLRSRSGPCSSAVRRWLCENSLLATVVSKISADGYAVAR